MRSILILLTVIALPVFADDVLVRDGATCEIPDGFNVGPFDGVWNPKGMGDFCQFPSLPLVEAIQEQLENRSLADTYTLPLLPECNQLVVSPNVQEYPCYEVKYE